MEHHAGHLAAAHGDRHGQRAVVALDIGVHLELEIPAGTGWREGERWNAEIAWEFLQAHSSWDEKRLRFELHRYLGWPGQAPSYKLGERIWLQAREEAKARAGDTFNLKDFHSKALSLGEMAWIRCARPWPAFRTPTRTPESIQNYQFCVPTAAARLLLCSQP